MMAILDDFNEFITEEGKKLRSPEEVDKEISRTSDSKSLFGQILKNQGMLLCGQSPSGHRYTTSKLDDSHDICKCERCGLREIRPAGFFDDDIAINPGRVIDDRI
jgi:hypothetical protein